MTRVQLTSNNKGNFVQ